MTRDDAAHILHGNSCDTIEDTELFSHMHSTGLVAVYGVVGDVIQFRGAIDDELPASDGDIFRIIQGRLVFPDERRRSGPRYVKSFKEKDLSWRYETDLPASRFSIKENNCLYCRGLIVDLTSCHGK